MRYDHGPYGYTVDSAANFYAAVVWGTSDGHVDLPGAIRAGNLVGILLPKENATSYSADDKCQVQREGVVRFNKDTGYTISKGDQLGVYDTSGNLAPVSELSLVTGTNYEILGTAEVDCASADTFGYMHLAHSAIQGE